MSGGCVTGKGKDNLFYYPYSVGLLINFDTTSLQIKKIFKNLFIQAIKLCPWFVKSVSFNKLHILNS